MAFRVNALVCMVVATSMASVYWALGHPAGHWLHFCVYLAAVLLSSGMKVSMPRSEGTMSVNFPFILLGILQLSPLQAVALAACSVVAQCRIRVSKPFTLVQVLFNVANVVTATVLAWHAYQQLLRLHVETAPALALAATVYFFANTIPVALIIAWSSGTSAIQQWRQNFPWYLPFYLVGAMLAAAANFVGLLFGWMTSLLLIPMVYTVYRAYRAQMAIVRDRERHIVETEALHLRTIEGLAMAIEAKDQSTHEHLLRVRVYVSEIGKLLGLDKPLMQALLTASFLHDIGKLAVPEHIINKPGKLTPEEFEKMKIHPSVGADILERVRFPYPVVPIVRSHHEAWDGSGYPDGLKGADIPIGARILSVVDCFDALASERPYRKALPLPEAMAMVRSRAGKQFDPDIVALLEAHYQELEQKACEQIEEIAPLETNLHIERGAAPGAGFAPDQVRSGGSDSLTGGAAPGILSLISAVSQEATALFELTQVLGSSLSARETSSMMFKRLQPLVPMDCFAVYVKSEEKLLTLFMDGPASRGFSRQPMAVGEGLSGWTALSQRPIVNGNPTVEANYLAESGLFSANGSALSIPLFDLAGVAFGVLTVYSSKPAAYLKDHLRILQAIQFKFSLALKNALRDSPAEEEPGHLTDHLTHLPNMCHFLEKLDAAIEKSAQENTRFGIAVCGLNSFKAANDRHGHLAGNQLLRDIAEEFGDECRPGDTVARMGGDQFLFLFPAMDSQGAHRPLDMIEHAVQRASNRLHPYPAVTGLGVSASAGMAFYPENGETSEDLLAAAERQMYRQKNAFYEFLRSNGLPSAPDSAVTESMAAR